MLTGNYVFESKRKQTEPLKIRLGLSLLGVLVRCVTAGYVYVDTLEIG